MPNIVPYTSSRSLTLPFSPCPSITSTLVKRLFVVRLCQIPIPEKLVTNNRKGSSSTWVICSQRTWKPRRQSSNSALMANFLFFLRKRVQELTDIGTWGVYIVPLDVLQCSSFEMAGHGAIQLSEVIRLWGKWRLAYVWAHHQDNMYPHERGVLFSCGIINFFVKMMSGNTIKIARGVFQVFFLVWKGTFPGL